MHSVNLITNRFKIFAVLMISAIAYAPLQAQDNSPYSRYGLGDLISGQNIVNKGMGGFAAAYSDYGIVGAPFNVNMINPASLGFLSNTKNFSNTIFDLGSEVSSRTLKSTTNSNKYTSNNAMISYLQIAFPISSTKMEKKGKFWGLSFGLRPLTRVNYKVEQNSRISNVDSINSLYEGTGGTNQANISSGFRIIGKGKHKNEFSIGLSSGYTFGNKTYSTRTSLTNDTVTYYKGNEEVQSRFGGVFLNTGVQYEMHFNAAGTLRLGAYANLQQNLNAKQSTINETFGYDGNGGVIRIDSVAVTNDVPGKVVIPTTIGAGFSYQSKNKNWLIGADFEMGNWASYKYYNQSENVVNNWTVRAGVEFYPAKLTAANNHYWNYIKYRTGFVYGPDYVKLKDVRYNYAATFGATFPLTTPRYIQSRGEYVAMHTSFELGARGNKQTSNLRENYMRFNIGISMNARWFQKRSYD